VMCIRTAEDGRKYAQCSECSKVEWAGSFDEERFRSYLPTLGWRVVPIKGRHVRLCPECYQDSTHW
jgi:hypothetical protein